MSNRIWSKSSLVRVAAVAMAVALGLSALPSAPASADDAALRVTLDAAIQADANTTAFSEDGKLGFVAAYGQQPGDEKTNYVYSFNTATGEVIDSKELSGYNPRQVVYSESNGLVAVRHAGHQFDDAGAFLPEASIDVFATQNYKPGEPLPQGTGLFTLRYSFPVWDPAVLIEHVSAFPAADALDDLAFSSEGRLLFYSNCVQMFAHDTQGSLLSGIPAINNLIDPYAGDQIAFFTYQPSFTVNADGERIYERVFNSANESVSVGYLAIGVNRTVEIPDDPATPGSEYQLIPNGRVLIFKVWSDPSNTTGIVGTEFVSQVDLGADGLGEGSNVCIDDAGRFGYVMGVDSGVVYTFRVETGSIRKRTTFAEFAARPNDPSSRGPRRIAFSSKAPVIVISRPGQISRPVNTNISRPVNTNISRPVNVGRTATIVETPQVALASVLRGGRLSVLASIGDFGGASSITNVAFDAAGERAFFATSGGALHALSVTDGSESTVGDVGSGAWSLELHAPTGTIAVVNGSSTDSDGNLIDAGGVTLFSIAGVASKGQGSGVGSNPGPTLVRPGHISRPCGASGN